MKFPTFHSSHANLNRAWRIAAGDFTGNLIDFQDGLLEHPAPCIVAGLDYDTPWTRDASINTQFCGALLCPEAAKNTLRSVMEEIGGRLYIAGQYWDKIIWVLGAMEYARVTGDNDFLAEAYKALCNTLEQMEENELDEQSGFFCGPAVYGDGVSAYADKYGIFNGSPSILDWVRARPELARKQGYGLPMRALSTNCVYYEAYRTAAGLSGRFAPEREEGYRQKAAGLLARIRKEYWNEERQSFDYYLDDGGERCEVQEGLGISFALLFGVAGEKRQTVLDHAITTPHGIACVEPSFERYRVSEEDFGRHSGTVWPQVQGYFAKAAFEAGRYDLFEQELFHLAENAVDACQFYEIYNPVTGKPYGGMQEQVGEGIILWKSCERQTWSATAFLSLCLYEVLGIRPQADGLHITPYLPREVDFAELKGLVYRGAVVNLTVRRGKGRGKAFLPADAAGKIEIELFVK